MHAISKRKVFARLSIATGNFLQAVGIVLAGLALAMSRSTRSPGLAVTAMLVSWILPLLDFHVTVRNGFALAVGV